MRSTSIQCKGLQSCLESQLLESHVLMNQLSPPISNSPNSMTCPKECNIPPNESIEENEDVSSWSFTQILENPCPYKNQADTEEEVYVHPSEKLFSTMNTRILDMCTESLGSETGADITESMDEFYSSSYERDISHGVQQFNSREFKKRIKRTVTFPPPLTSISGLDYVQVRSYREGSRLVLRAVRISSSSSYFQADRSNGRLRLSWLKDVTTSIDTNSYEEDVMKVEQDAELENSEEAEVKFNKHEHGSKTLGGEIGIGEYPRPRRCKESGSRSKAFPNCGQFWVAIS